MPKMVSQTEGEAQLEQVLLWICEQSAPVYFKVIIYLKVKEKIKLPHNSKSRHL